MNTDKLIKEFADCSLHTDALKKQIAEDAVKDYKGLSHRDILFNEKFGGPLVIMRHGDYNSKESSNPLYGKNDGPINEGGKHYLNMAIPNLAQYLPTGIVIVSSTAKRAVTTADALSEGLEKLGILTVRKIALDELCECADKKYRTKKNIYALLQSQGLFTENGISCVTIVITHQPNIETYLQDLNAKDLCIPNLEMIFETGKHYTPTNDTFEP